VNCDEKKFLPGFEKPNKVSQGDAPYISSGPALLAERAGSTKAFIKLYRLPGSEFSVSAKRYSNSEDRPFCAWLTKTIKSPSGALRHAQKSHRGRYYFLLQEKAQDGVDYSFSPGG
jgi:hypothetical protein